MKPPLRTAALFLLASTLPLLAAKKPDFPASKVTPPTGTYVPASPKAFPGGSVTFFGTLAVTDPTYNRSTTGIPCGPLSGVGTAVFYDTYTITNSTAGALSVIIHMTAPGGGLATFDTYVHAYSPTFDPANPMTNCVAANDDGPLGIGESLITGAPLAAGANMIIVADSFNNGEVGDYGICVTDQGSACTTPAELVNFQVL